MDSPLGIEVLVQKNHTIPLRGAAKEEIVDIQILQHLVLRKQELEDLQNLNSNIDFIVPAHLQCVARGNVTQGL